MTVAAGRDHVIKVVAPAGYTLHNGERVIGVEGSDLISEVKARLLEKVGHPGYPAAELGLVKRVRCAASPAQEKRVFKLLDKEGGIMLIKVVAPAGDTLLNGERVIGVEGSDLISEVKARLLEKVGHPGYPAAELGLVKRVRCAASPAQEKRVFKLLDKEP
ncbi:hypothetical protein DIPPA_01921 [Diplonema papillatum]|nr:hypothetical protein DIPPA_01921 [Diplonema papillatum]